MNTNSATQPLRPCRPLYAASLSSILPGLGHLYCGNLRTGCYWMGSTILVLILAIVVCLFDQTGRGFTLCLYLLAADCVLWLVSTVQAWLLARRLSHGRPTCDFQSLPLYGVLILSACIASGLGVAFVLRERVLQAFHIPTASMAPTLLIGDKILVRKEAFLHRDPERGELVVFRGAENRDRVYVKRCVAVAGDTVEWRPDGSVSINGSVLTQETTTGKQTVRETNHNRSYDIWLGQSPVSEGKLAAGVLTVPAGHCFVLGDNRGQSLDSRLHGCISYAALLGTPIGRYWPLRGKLE